MRTGDVFGESGGSFYGINEDHLLWGTNGSNNADGDT